MLFISTVSNATFDYYEKNGFAVLDLKF